MPDYDFHQLSPHDLEVLTRDLLQAHWNITLESFKTGRDGGIDLRYASGTDNTIVQVKHYLRTGFDGLLRELKNETAKIRKLQPRRYVLVTSVPLSPQNKDDIIKLVGSGTLSYSDVLGQESLNNLLGLYPTIEQNHYKLWLASRAVLDKVLHNAAITRSEFKACEVHQEARRYVASSAYPQALKMLADRRVVIISGAPGVGKSTLAKLLLYGHLEKGYQAVFIERDIKEGGDLFQTGVKQVFYFDDFMGATFLGDRSALSTTDRALLSFIGLVRATPTARFILTTREHIYLQAMERSERFRHSDLDDLRVLLRIPDYSLFQKAQILYNHIYFSNLPLEYKEEILHDDYYFRIIKHQKFNPRLVEWLASFRRIRNIPVNKYRAFIQDLLQDPSEIWRHAYEQEITDATRSLLLAMFSLSGRSSESLLRCAFLSLHYVRAVRYGFRSCPEDFRLALREAEGTFVRITRPEYIEVLDPSVLDLMNTVLRSNPDNIVDILVGAASFDQIEQLWSFTKARGGIVAMTSIRYGVTKITSSVRRQMLVDRRVDLGDGAIAYRGSTFERRLSTLIDMAERLEHPSFGDLIESLFERLQQEWKAEQKVEIKDGVAVLQVLDAIGRTSQAKYHHILVSVRSALLKEAAMGCSSEELRCLLTVFDVTNRKDEPYFALRSAFGNFRKEIFSTELVECFSLEDFDNLTENLVTFRKELGVKIGSLLANVEEERKDFKESNDYYDEGEEDELRQQWREERAGAQAVSDMFGSLKGEPS
ncbi:MAG TPA: restriction endonuclease [Geminicoccus sp.]|jgi:predicted ATPase|uniref:nSTAND3 domain-containing NTPase n=1 Tax=Geminicoccus sp. TaxID=2024832 RepID=UPI002E33CD1A|nr:restriction endonuclease [Geminicoccus sp.]HEX2526766.1 restriction endonuclease [Geminicoccus sp.]